MKVCFVHEEYPEETNFGGIATYQKVTAEELVKQGHQVYVICRGLENDKQYIENGVNIYRIYVEKTKNQVRDYVRYRKRVSSLLKKLQDNNLIDIIEVPDWGAESVLFEQYRKLPIVVRLHTPLKVWLKYNRNNFGKITDLMLKWEDSMIKRANLVTCCSQALKNMIVDNFEINESQILVTPNSANITNFYRDETIKKENKLIFVGSLEERKGVIVLANALNIIFKKYPDLKIEFIGKDTDRNNENISTIQLVYKIVNQKYKNNIKFIGQIPNYELNKYLNSSRVGIFPSLFDNFPYAVLEAMATGLHIVGSKNSGMVEMLNDDSSIYETGNYKDLANKVLDEYYKIPKEERARGINVTVSASSFVPKPFTPFEWVPQNSMEEIIAKQEYLKEKLKRKGITFNYHQSDISVMEAVFARGDRKLNKVLVNAVKNGCKFDGWGEYYNPKAWAKAFEDAGINPDFYARRDRELEEVFPWDFVSVGVNKEFLKREYKNAQEEKVTPNCRQKCAGCGIKDCAERDRHGKN